MSNQLRCDQEFHQRMLIVQLSSLSYPLWQGLAIQGHEELEGNLIQLLYLRAEDNVELSVGFKKNVLYLVRF